MQRSPTRCFQIQATFYILLVLKIILVFHLRLEKRSLESSELEREVTPSLVLEFERSRLLEAYTLLWKFGRCRRLLSLYSEWCILYWLEVRFLVFIVEQLVVEVLTLPSSKNVAKQLLVK